MKAFIFQNLKSGLTVSLVSIPLSIALALASGATPTQGAITAFWAGLIGALFGSSNFNVIGPTGALSGILVSYALIHGYAALSAIAILSGIFIFFCFLFHLDRYIIFIPKSVIHGFTLGVALLIILGQIDNALGLMNVPKTERLITNVWLSLQHLKEADVLSVGVFGFCTLFTLLWNKKFKNFPGAIVIAVCSIFGVLIYQKVGQNIPIKTLGELYPHVKGVLHLDIITEMDWGLFLKKDIILLSMTTAVIAILETLLSGQIADQMTKTRFSRSKEILGLALANIGSGFMGGIPATAALARTALNIKSGATHKVSGIFSAIFVALVSVFLLQYFKLMPMVVVASILVIVGLGMVEIKHFVYFINNDHNSFGISLLVAVIVLLEDPIIGILVGSFAAIIIFLNKVSYGQTEVFVWKNGKMREILFRDEFLERENIDSDVIVYKISGMLTYINMPSHQEAIEKISGNNYVVLSLRQAFYADMDGIIYLEEIIETIRKNNKNIILTGINKEIEMKVKKASFYTKKLVDNKIYKRTSEALEAIRVKENTSL